MTCTFNIQQKYLEAIQEGTKTVEGRIYRGRYTKVAPGDKVCFLSGSIKVLCRVLSVNKYSKFEQMLEKEGVNRCLPGIYNTKEGIRIYYSFGNYKELEKQYGVVAFKIKKIQSEKT